MRPNLVFLPGAGASPNFWRPLGDLLPEAWGKTFLHWPGIGHETADPNINGLADLVRLTESKLNEGPVDLLAQSMGGAIALQVALQNPTRVRRIVLVATAGGIDVDAFGATDWRPEYRRDYPRAAPWITEERLDLSNQLHRVFQPTLLLWGEHDSISPPAVGRRLSQLLPEARLHIVPNGDHGFVHSRPEVIAGLIRDHLT